MSSNPSSRQTALVVGCCAAVIAAACARRAAAAAARAARQRPSSHHQTGVLLDGSDLVVRTNPGEVRSNGGTKREAGKGMPIKGGPSRGDLIIEFVIGRL